MYIASELLIVLIEIAIIHLYLQGLFVKKALPLWLWLLSYFLFGVAASALSFIPDASYIRLAFFGIGVFILGRCLFTSTIIQAVFCSVLFCAVFVLTDVLMYLLLTMLHIDSSQLLAAGLPRLIWSIASHAMTFTLVLIIISIVSRGRSVITWPFILVIVPGCIISIILGCYFCRIAQNGDALLPIPFLLASIGLIYMNILLVFYAQQAKAVSDEKMELELEEQHYIMQEQYYEQLRNEQNETRAMFHEINKYLLAMHALIDGNDLQQASRTLQDAEELFGELGQVTDVGNSVINIILNEYRLKMITEEISFSFDVSVPPNLGITAVDAYILLGNALDNAIAACKLLPPAKRYVHLQMRKFHEILFFQIRNPFPEAYHARKQEKGHGYGLKNIKKCVEKYGGDVQVSTTAFVFELSARINIG